MGPQAGLSCLEDGIITEIELRNLLLDHLDYECAHVSGRAWMSFDPVSRRTLMDMLDDVLYGRPAMTQ